MTYKIYGNFKQSGEVNPVLVQAFGDNYGSLVFTQTPDIPVRDSRGVYRFLTGDELGTGDDINKNIFVSFGLTSPVKSYRVGVVDTMQIQIETFDAAGSPIDIDGNFSITLILNV